MIELKVGSLFELLDEIPLLLFGNGAFGNSLNDTSCAGKDENEKIITAAVVEINNKLRKNKKEPPWLFEINKF
jgi:hypothetical protein